MNAARPGIVAEVDQQMAAASHALDQMVDMYRRNVPGVDVDAAAVFVLMTKTTVHVYDPVETAQLLSIAIARLGSTPAPSGDLFAEDFTATAGHHVSTIAPNAEGVFTAICSRGDFTATDPDYDTAAALLDAHIAETAGA